MFGTAAISERMPKRLNALPTVVHYDLYFLTAPDFAFVQDGTREGEHIRLEMHQWLLDVLNQKGKPYILVEGSMSNAWQRRSLRLIPLLVFPVLDAP
jgi:nicotinamide riboside kinase